MVRQLAGTWGGDSPCPACGRPTQWFIPRGSHPTRYEVYGCWTRHVCPGTDGKAADLIECFCGVQVRRRPDGKKIELGGNIEHICDAPRPEVSYNTVTRPVTPVTPVTRGPNRINISTVGGVIRL